MRTKLLLATLLLTAFCYGQEFNFNEINTTGRQLVFAKPDSAVAYIKQGLREAKRKKVHDTIISDLYNLYGIREIMLTDFDSAIHYFQKSADYSKDFKKRQTKPLINIALCIRNKGDYDESIKQLNVLLKTGDQSDKTKAIIYGEMASNYALKFDNDTAIKYLLKAIEVLKRLKNDVEIYPVKQKLANIYLTKGNYNFGLDLYNECIEGFKKSGDLKNYYYTLLNRAECLIQLDRLSEAKNDLRISLEGLKTYNDIAVMGVAYSKIGHIEVREGNEKQAMEDYQHAIDNLLLVNSPYVTRIGMEYINHLNRYGQKNKSLKIVEQVTATDSYKNANIEDKMYFLQAMADTYNLTGNYKKAAENYVETVKLKDSIAIMDKESALNEVQGRLQNELQREKNIALENRNEALEQNAKKNRIIFWASIIISLAIIALILFILRAVRLKSQLQNEELKTIAAEKNLLEQQAQHDKEFFDAQRERIKEKQRELTSSALRMANIQDSINNIIDKCKNNSLTSVNEVRKELQHLVKQKDYWKQFETRFNKVHPEFNTILADKFENLTKNDLEFCSLLKLNLSNKEIASLLQISHESVITKKYRIKKKMNIQEDVEFDKLIMEI
ncbi:tetratricopeptide repeat protein [Flavobacterium alkalisoli]|uniref:tetratricopeptide repeat protein n=1 Tax=Flavobacterium alkalisoli TaxID=2602769 RepID=UPI003A90DCDD